MLKQIIILLFLCFFTAKTETGLLPFEDLDQSDIVKSILTNHMHLETNLVMSVAEIKKFNKKMYTKGYVNNPLIYPENYWGTVIRQNITGDINFIENIGVYNIRGRALAYGRRSEEFKWNMNLGNIKDKTLLRFAAVRNNTRMRLAPTDTFRMLGENEYNFDMLQIMHLQVGDILAVFHTSADGQWIYGVSKFSRGWVRLCDLVFYKKSVLKNYESIKRLYITGREVRVYRDMEGTDSYSLYMGKNIPWVDRDSRYYHIIVPGPGSAFATNYINVCEDISESPLFFYRLNLARQFFKMLGDQYSWGEYSGKSDCLSMIQRVYACFGVDLPKKFSHQKESFKKTDFSYLKNNFQNLEPFTTFFYLPGHIMVYIGQVRGKPLVIHNFWKYYNEENKPEIVGKVVVSGLDLGMGRKKGSLGNWINDAEIFKN